jgi:hypothetical protein
LSHNATVSGLREARTGVTPSDAPSSAAATPAPVRPLDPITSTRGVDCSFAVVMNPMSDVPAYIAKTDIDKYP